MKLSEFSKKYGDVEINEKELKNKLGIRNKAWQPKNDDKYYFTTDHCEIRYSLWKNNICHKNRYELGNCFQTQKEAENYVEKLKIIAKLKRFAIENNEGKIDWKDDKKPKYSFVYDHNYEEIHIVEDWTFQRYGIYFTTHNIADSAIKFIGEDRLKKYYFEVKEKENC